MWRTESAFNQATLVAVTLAPAAFRLGRSLSETALVLLTPALVLTTGPLNPAFEALVTSRVDSSTNSPGAPTTRQQMTRLVEFHRYVLF